MVKTLQFGDIQVPSPGFGAMGLSFGLGTNLSLEEAEPVLLKAIELGCTFWDTAVCLIDPGPAIHVSIVNCVTDNIMKGRISSRRQREAPRRVHPKTQCPR